MDVREKLVELLQNAKAAMKSENLSCDIARNMFVVDFMMANGVTVHEWKPISEPPKEKGTYLVCTDNGGVLLGHWYGTAWNVGGGAKKHLAYWMEKPQPPKGE